MEGQRSASFLPNTNCRMNEVMEMYEQLIYTEGDRKALYRPERIQAELFQAGLKKPKAQRNLRAKLLTLFGLA